jgi:hypothetical protein
MHSRRDYLIEKAVGKHKNSGVESGALETGTDSGGGNSPENHHHPKHQPNIQ